MIQILILKVLLIWDLRRDGDSLTGKKQSNGKPICIDLEVRR